MIQLILTLIVIGVLLWAANTPIPMDGKIKKIKKILNVVVVVCVVIWLLNVFGFFPADAPVPHFHYHR